MHGLLITDLLGMLWLMRPLAATRNCEMATKKQKFMYEGREIYEWEQSLDEVLVYIKPPPGIRAAQIDCKIETSRFVLGLKGNPPFLDHKLPAACVAKDSFWNLDDGNIIITLTKAKKGETWPCAFVGQGTLDPLAETEVQKSMLLERFQQEHPGFDFSGAQVNGIVPDPRTFMGGINNSAYR